LQATADGFGTNRLDYVERTAWIYWASAPLLSAYASETRGMPTRFVHVSCGDGGRFPLRADASRAPCQDTRSPPRMIQPLSSSSHALRRTQTST
jgi:hypothetical protein